MVGSKNYILSKENGNKILLRRFMEYKITGVGFFVGFLFLGLLLIFANFNGERFYLYGIILICIGLFICILLFPLSIKVTEHKDKFLIEKVNSLWTKKRFEITKKKNPKILGVETINLGIHSSVYNLKISYSGGEVKLSNYPVQAGSGFHDPSLNTLKEIKEIAKFFKIPYIIR